MKFLEDFWRDFSEQQAGSALLAGLSGFFLGAALTGWWLGWPNTDLYVMGALAIGCYAALGLILWRQNQRERTQWFAGGRESISRKK